MKSRCIVVIGHVDHGKTALTQALTGTQTDTLPEEKARGLTIAPGFAHCTYPGGILDLVDAPGHADFIQGMICGASGAQGALIVISLAEGMGAQTWEHLQIAELLGIRHGVVALSKSDLVPAAEQAARVEGLRAQLAQTAFAEAPLILCSAKTGTGITALHQALEKMLHHAPPPSGPLQCFLPIDRAFSLAGQGTIVTGTLLGQALEMETPLALHPDGQAVSLRALQSRGDARSRVEVGARMAANLRGVMAKEISRGAVLYAADSCAPSDCVDIQITALPLQAAPFKHMQELRVLFGTSNEVAQLRLFKAEDGARDFAQLRFRKPVVSFAGQRAVLRRLSPPATLGGAIILDPQAAPARVKDQTRLRVLRAAQAQEPRAIAQTLCAANGIADVSDIARLARLSIAEANIALGSDFICVSADSVSTKQNISEAETALKEALARYHQQHPLRVMVPQAALQKLRLAPLLLRYVEQALVKNGKVRRQDKGLALCAHDPMAALSPEQHQSVERILVHYRDTGLSPAAMPLPDDKDHAELTNLLIETGALVALRNVALKQTLVFHADVLSAAATALAAAFPAPTTFSTSQARTALETSRRIIVPLLEHFDHIGLSLRTGDLRQMKSN